MMLIMKTLPWLRKAGKGLKSFFSGVRRLFNRKPAEKAEPVSPETSAPSLDEDESYEEYLQKIDGLDDVVVKLGLHKRIAASHKYMYEMGRRDGALGVRLHNVIDIARATAQAMFRHIYVILRGKTGAVEAELESVQKIKDDEEKLYNREQSYYNYVKYQYRFFPRSHSFFLFFLYLIIAFALILADMPLALKLIQNGFDLGGQDFSKLFVKGHFLKVISTNWETILTAFGIALCTIYIKIYYDEFVGTPYANRLMTFKKFLEENKVDHFVDGDGKSIRKEHRAKSIWKTAFFIITIAAILSLAFFRLETAVDNKEFRDTIIAKAAFVFITLLFPLIGGVCLSYSLNNLQNLTRIGESRRKYNRHRKQLLKAVQDYTLVKGNAEDLAAATARLGDEARVVEEYKNYLIAFYERGYAIGGMQPEKYTRGEDFYTKILEWRNIAVSRKINHNIAN